MPRPLRRKNPTSFYFVGGVIVFAQERRLPVLKILVGFRPVTIAYLFGFGHGPLLYRPIALPCLTIVVASCCFNTGIFPCFT